MEKDDFVKVLEYIENHITEKISLKELADFAGYSPYYFSKLFSNIYGLPVMGYIRIRKLQYSVGSLLAGMKVIDVALLYSFESHEGFTRSFVKLFGSSPSIIKRHLKQYKLPDVLDCVNAEYFDEKENSVKNKLDSLFFTQAICAQASQSSFYRRAESEIRLAIPPTHKMRLRNGD